MKKRWMVWTIAAVMALSFAASNSYVYVVQSCKDEAGDIKGISFQCCPSLVYYRRSVAKDILGCDDPDTRSRGITGILA